MLSCFFSIYGPHSFYVQIWLIQNCIINGINSNWCIKFPVIGPVIWSWDLISKFYCSLLHSTSWLPRAPRLLWPSGVFLLRRRQHRGRRSSRCSASRGTHSASPFLTHKQPRPFISLWNMRQNWEWVARSRGEQGRESGNHSETVCWLKGLSSPSPLYSFFWQVLHSNYLTDQY